MSKGFHFIGWGGDWHILDDKTIRSKNKRTLCGRSIPNPDKNRVSLVSRDPETFSLANFRNPGLKGCPKRTCNECLVWVEIEDERSIF